MRNSIIFILLLAANSAGADELIQFSDGTTAWRGSNGQIWGKTPPPPQSRQNDSQYQQPNNNLSGFGSDGTFYAPAGGSQVLDTRTGRFVPVR